MDPRTLYPDERHSFYCVYCGATPTTNDHVPSKVLLDEPLPDNLPVVQACDACNNGFSLDEEYAACMIECALAGSVDPAAVCREKVRRTLTARPDLGSLIERSRRHDLMGNILWQPDAARVRNVVLKLARGHAAYEWTAPQLAEPQSVSIVLLGTLAEEQRRSFETPPVEDVWPELGSRAFSRAVVAFGNVFLDVGWQVIQAGRYRYLVSHSHSFVRVVLSEYLACEVAW